MKRISKKMFYFLSFTWGLPMSIVGTLVFGVLMIFGKRPKRFGHSYYIEIGKMKAGCELGCFFLIGKGMGDFTKTHELGHAYQNACIFGPIMLFAVSLPSFLRFWYRKIKQVIFKKPCKTGYYDIWFEKQANKIGAKVINKESETLK